MQDDGKAVKGRGASGRPDNRFLVRQYGTVEPEGVDVPWEEPRGTRLVEVYPRTIVNEVRSPDLPFRYSVNAYQGCEHGCSYCYARPTHEYWGYSAGLDFEKVVLVKRNAPGLLAKALAAPRWEVAPIALSGATDPYQPAERTERLTRGLLDVLWEHRHPAGLITKNAAVLRDLDLLTTMAGERLVSVAVSLTTLDEDLRRVMEPRTSTTARRLEAIAALRQAGVPVMAMIAPIVPGLTDHELPRLLKSASEAGALSAGYTVLRTNGAVETVFREWLHVHRPDRAAKVIAQTAAVHGGNMHDSTFGRRMKGEGRHAENIQRLFRVFRDRYFKGRAMPVLDTMAFRRPSRGQLALFT